MALPRAPVPHSRLELMLRALALEGAPLGEVAGAMGVQVPASLERAKGWAGQLIERALGADPKAGSRPDFPQLGVELKTIPVGASGRPRESTFCCSIRMADADSQAWEDSRLRRRLACVLWVPVAWVAGAAPADQRIGRPCLWRPDADETARLRADWELLMGHIGAGLAEQLSARQGEVLQVRPKAAHAQVRTWAPAEGGRAPTLPLGFYLRTAFTAAILAAAAARRGEAEAGDGAADGSAE